ncbi:hypothetical protein [Xylophilus sp. GOD-11R]|uniref:hypothetical protein n=1 Tax=Xylophilus sp. GOD-11R TaxID=3089814 RepID=UPI00298BCD10|nr:hypothetical protein [Xylophilus sp. GOD-11R]WPB58729.1 hypothetical protein R9X41_08850 [Xylophilus sp. GOD-11R]
MSGERSQQFRTTPSYTAPDANPAARISTNQSQAVAAQVQGQGSAFASLGSSLSNFFGGVEKAVEQYSSTRHSEDMAGIERQRAARAVQAQADHAAGRPRDPGLNEFQDYKGTYDTAVADTTASGIATDLQAAIRNLPDTPGTDLKAFATSFVTDQMKGGTGDPAIDGRVAYVVQQRAEQMIARKTEQIAQTSEANIAETIGKSLTLKIQEQQGATVEQVEGLYSEALGLMKGNIGHADKFFAGVLSRAIYNPGQAASVLAAMRESGFAKRNPDVYLELTEKVWAQTNRVKSVAAGQAVERVNASFHAAQLAYQESGTFMPVQEYLTHMKEASDVDNIHGVGMAQFPWVRSGPGGHRGAREALQKQADVNVILDEMRKPKGDLRLRLSQGKDDIEYSKAMRLLFIPAVNQWVTENATLYPAIAATQTPQGGFDFLATPESAKEFGRLLGIHGASFGFGVDDNTSARLQDFVMSDDPAKVMIAATGLAALQATPGGDQYLQNILKDSSARARLDVVLTQARDSGGLENAARSAVASRTSGSPRTSETSKGPGSAVDWKTVLGDPSVNGDATRATIQGIASELVLSAQDRSGWLIRDDKMNFAPAVMGQLERLTVQHLEEQRVNLPMGAKPNLQKAATWATEQIKAKVIPVAAQNGVLRYIPDQYGGKGRRVDSPVAYYQGQPVYAGMKMLNRLGEMEDPQRTFTEIDRPALAKAFPGFLGNRLDPGEPNDLYLNPPDQKVGLMQVMTNGQRPLAFYGGMPVRIGDKDLEVPKSPADADTFFRTRLPKGFFAVPGAPDSSGRNTYRIHYGYRLQGDNDAFDKAIADKAYARKAEIAEIKAATDPVTGSVQNQRTPIAHPNYRK